MKRTIVSLMCIALAISSAIGEQLPKGWFKAGSNPKDYSMAIDRETKHSGKSSASLKSITNEPGGFGTLMQTFKADVFRGKRVRLTGYVRSKDVADWAGLWMRMDGPRGEVLSFDNMQKRAIKATTDWTRYEIVLDVPDPSQEVAFGLLLSGKGQVWMDDLNFEVVSKDVPTTGGSIQDESNRAAVNLDFEE